MKWSLRRRYNGRDSVSNHQPHDCLLNRLFRRRSKKTSKLRVTGLCAGNSPGTGEFPAQMASYAENVSIWWRHHDIYYITYIPQYFVGTGEICIANGPLWRESTGLRWIPLTKASGAVLWCLIYAWTNGWANNRDAGDSSDHRANCHVTVRVYLKICWMHNVVVDQFWSKQRTITTLQWAITTLQVITTLQKSSLWSRNSICVFTSCTLYRKIARLWFMQQNVWSVCNIS